VQLDLLHQNKSGIQHVPEPVLFIAAMPEFAPCSVHVEVDEHNPNNVTAAPASMVMRFGSGDISTKIASDEVQIGPLKVYMENGLLLMVPRMKNDEDGGKWNQMDADVN
jgi:hypothetical protein